MRPPKPNFTDYFLDETLIPKKSSIVTKKPEIPGAQQEENERKIAAERSGF